MRKETPIKQRVVPPLVVIESVVKGHKLFSKFKQNVILYTRCVGNSPKHRFKLAADRENTMSAEHVEEFRVDPKGFMAAIGIGADDIKDDEEEKKASQSDPKD